MRTRDRGALWLGLAVCLAAMAMLFVLNCQITVYSDDYWYGTFYDGGLLGFLREMASHYFHTNGRLYVHLIIPTVLLFDTKLFAVLSPLLLALLYALGAKFLDRKLALPGLLLAAGLGVLTTMALDVAYLRMTLLWIAAYFNYIFPVLVTMAALVFQRRWHEGEQGRWEHRLGLFTALLAGASTEQGGIVSLVMVWGWAILDGLFHGGERRRWRYPLAVLLGFATILLSPGSWARVDRGIEGGILSCLIPSVFAQRFFDVMIYTVAHPSPVILLTAVDLLAALACLQNRERFRGLLSGFAFALGQAACYLLGWTRAGCVLSALSLLTLGLCFLPRREDWPIALTLAGSLASHLMLIITTLYLERTAMVGLVCLIVAAVGLLLQVTGGLPRGAALAVLAGWGAVCAAAYLPTLAGYRGVKQVMDANLASVEESRETGAARFNVDMDPRYRFTMCFEGEYFYQNFRNYYKMDPETRLVFTSGRWTTAELAGGEQPCHFPTLSGGGRLYFPFDYAVAAAGGSAVYSWRDHSYAITLGDRKLHIDREGTVFSVGADGSLTPAAQGFTLLLPFSETYTLIYCDAAQLRDILGISWTGEGAGYRILP